MTETASSIKKDIQKLQRAIVDGLEDVKGQDLKVFDTEHLSSLFERVIIASGASNRQTKALAASVRDKVREAGFPKPRIEGEENGEWIIVDCGAAVAHVMQPAIRQYYNLEEIWGEKPVRLKLGAAKPAAAKTVKKPAAEEKSVARPVGKMAASRPVKVETLKVSKKPISDRKSALASVKQSFSAPEKVEKKAAAPIKKVVVKGAPTRKAPAAPAKKPAAAKTAAAKPKAAAKKKPATRS